LLAGQRRWDDSSRLPCRYRAGHRTKPAKLVGGAPVMLTTSVHELDALWPFTQNSRWMTVTLKGSDLASNHRDEQEMSVLCLRILQAALVYVNNLWTHP
jgi:hypothetical protein